MNCQPIFKPRCHGQRRTRTWVLWHYSVMATIWPLDAVVLTWARVCAGGSDTLVRSVNLLTNEQEGPRSPPKPLPAHLFKEMQRFHAQAPPDVAPSGPDATPPPDTRAQ